LEAKGQNPCSDASALKSLNREAYRKKKTQKEKGKRQGKGPISEGHGDKADQQIPVVLRFNMAIGSRQEGGLKRPDTVTTQKRKKEENQG